MDCKKNGRNGVICLNGYVGGGYKQPLLLKGDIILTRLVSRTLAISEASFSVFTRSKVLPFSFFKNLL